MRIPRTRESDGGGRPDGRQGSALKGAALWALLMAACALLPGADAPLPPEKPGPNGLELMAQERYQEALPALDSELLQHPGSLALGVARAKCLLELGRWDEALAYTRGLTAKNPAQDDTRILEGDCLFFLFRPREALARYEPLLKSERWGAVVLPKVVNACLALGQEAEALDAIRSAQSSGVAMRDAVLGARFRIEEDPAAKLAALRNIQAVQPDSPGLAEEMALYTALAAGPKPLNTPPSSYPTSTKVKEIGREMCIPAKIGGKRHWFGFDTGSETLLVNADMPRKLGLGLVTSTVYEGWGYEGKRKSAYVVLESMEVAGRTLTRVPAVVNTRDSEFSTNKAGYLGLQPFLHDVVLYDRRGGRFGLWPAGSTPSAILGSRGTVLPVLWGRTLPLVPVKLQGHGPYPFLLDTGAPWSLLAAQYAPYLGIRVNSGKYGNLHALGMSGAFSSGVTEDVTLGLGDRTYPLLVAFVTEVPQRLPVPVYGILGRDILNGFKMVFDCPGNTVTLVPYDAPPARGSGK